MTIDSNENLIFNDFNGKTQCITKEQLKNAWELYASIKPQSFCANYERDNVEQLTTGDKIVGKVIEQFTNRSKFGQKKYNTTLENNNLGLKQWCQHIQEELMDAVNYLEKIKSIL